MARAAPCGVKRRQFARQIGSFQAVKHRCAEMVVRSYSARTELYVAALLLTQDGDGTHLSGDGESYCADKIIENLKLMGFGS